MTTLDDSGAATALPLIDISRFRGPAEPGFAVATGTSPATATPELFGAASNAFARATVPAAGELYPADR
ncbi:hypothetical protein [Amycolatopsis solani]|uniref:hypothetical protein n=1 Tax=Amycolatopsis solani TaxID=3028615 RepID=UPI0025B13060|nr:hypothetical protein [Amycolatopsis sp. MEP2-6]